MTTSGRSLSLRIAGGVACGLLALALNSFPLPMLGRESPAFAFGGALVIFAFWQLGLVPGLIAALVGYAVGSLPRELMFTMMALYALEGYATARLTTRIRSLVVADVTFWLTLGVLLDLLAYRWWMDLSTGLVLLIIVKQLLNGVLNAAIAEGIARIALVRKWVGAPPRTARPLTEVLFARTVPVVMLPMTIIVMLLARASYAAQYNQLAAELRRAATGVEEGAQRFLQSRHSSLGNFAMQLRMSRPASAERELARFHAAHPEFVNIFITDAAGIVRYASPAASVDGLQFVGRDLSLRPYFDAARSGKRAVVGELVQGQLHVRRESPEPILPVAVPLYTDTDAFDGIVMGALDANALRPLLSARLSSETGMAQMLDRAGHVVVSTSPRWKPGDTRADELPSLFANDTTYPVALRSGTRESYADMLGVDPRITVVQPVSGFDFAALVDAPLSAVYAAMATTSLELLLLMLVALLAVHAVSRSLGAQLVGPLESIGAVATDLAGGHYAPREVLDRLDSSPDGEIRTLASQLGVMDDALRARHEADAARVAQSERKYRETLEQLAQAQKMEGIGRLAGGIAHDFNNLLTPIVGYTDLAMAAVPAGNPARRDLSLVRTAANRAKEVVAQLLAFGRAQVLDVNRIDLAETVAEFEPLLRRTLSADIELAVIAEPGVTVEADRAKVQQVLMNLVINAADAMAAGGRVEVRVGVEEVVEVDPAEPEPLAPGTYGVIMVSDTGVGMDDETRLRAFDPFFTTKPRGKGTGLGLSTAYGIARQHRGTIRVESTAGVGTRMRVLLPLAAPSPYVSGENPVRTERVPEPVPQSAKTGATLMVVEDEGAVRELVRVALTRAGFRILAARDGDEALTRAAAHDGRIDLLLTDVVMPGLNGRELARRFRASRPEARVLFMSGYAADVISAEGVLAGDADLLVKPFSPDELVQRVRAALAR